MHTLVAAKRDPAALLVVGSLGILTAAVLTGRDIKFVGALVVLVAIIATLYRSLFRWHSLVGLLLAVVLFVPIGRYRLPGNLPFNLELYRVVVALVVAIWIASLLVDTRVRWHRTPFDRPLLLLLACVLLSEVTNSDRVNRYGSEVAKTMTFFLSFVLVYFIVSTQVRRRQSIDFLLQFLTVGGAIIGAFAIVERRTHFNVFNHLHPLLPFLTYVPDNASLFRGGDLRAVGPSEQPIALGALLVMILPISVYFARTRGRRWVIAAVLLVVGALATASRTALTMIAAEFILYLIFKPRETRRLLPLAVPAILVIHVLAPGSLGGLKDALFPKGGLIAEGTQLSPDANAQLAGGRIRQIRPMLTEASHHPFFGEGVGTRITGFNSPDRNAPILDNQWLNNVLDVGFVGLGLWVWLFVRSIRLLLRRARQSNSDGHDDEWLFLALASSILALAVGMLTFDAFSFTQVPFIFWIVLGLVAALLSEPPQNELIKPPARLRSAAS